jgi:flavin reductase (DIM6/NTAB) family NADH-FMN oxidoreductase RutF
MRILNNVNNFIQSKVFTIHLVIKNFESVDQHVAYITEHDEARGSRLKKSSCTRIHDN